MKKPTRHGYNTGKGLSEKDGRRLALAMLREFQKAKKADDLAANPKARAKGKIQRNLVGDYLWRLHVGCTDECREGFASLLTDMFWMFFHVGEPSLSAYERNEKRGKLDGQALGMLE